MTTEKLEKVHRDRHSMAAKLKEAQGNLESLRSRHIEAVADGQPDAKLTSRVTEAEGNLKTLEQAYQLLGRRHIEALRAVAEEEAAQARDRMAEMTALEVSLTIRLNAALVEHIAAEAAYQDWKQALGPASRHCSPQPPITVIEGLPSEIRDRVVSDATLTIGPTELEEALASLEALAKTQGFEAHTSGLHAKMVTFEGKHYLPVVGRCKITWDANTGLVLGKEILTTLAIESAVVDGVLKPVPGVMPAPLPKEPPVGIRTW